MAELPNILRDIAELKDAVRKLETIRQPIGGDIIKVSPGDLVTTGGITLAAGTEVSLTVTVTPNDPKLTLWSVFQTIHVDTDDSGHRWPDGAFLSSAQAKVRLQWHWDWESSNDTAGSRQVFVHIKNEDTSSHTYYYYVKFYNMNVPFT